MKVFKKTIFAVLTLGFVVTTTAQTEEEAKVEKIEYKNQFFMLPTSLAEQIVQFGYERKFSKNSSAMVQFGMYIEGSNVLDDPTINGSGIRLEANYNMIFDDMSNKSNHQVSFYISPYVNYFNANFTIGTDFYNKEYATMSSQDSLGNYTINSLTEDSLTEDASANINHIGLGATFGLRWTISERLVFDFYAGGGAQLVNYVGDRKFTEPLKRQFLGTFINNGIIGRGGIRIGILF